MVTNILMGNAGNDGSAAAEAQRYLMGGVGSIRSAGWRAHDVLDGAGWQRSAEWATVKRHVDGRRRLVERTTLNGQTGAMT